MATHTKLHNSPCTPQLTQYSTTYLVQYNSPCTVQLTLHSTTHLAQYNSPCTQLTVYTLTHPVYDAGAVYVFKAPQHLVDKELNVIVRELLCFDNVVQISSHQRSHEVPEHSRTSSFIYSNTYFYFIIQLPIISSHKIF